MPEDKILEEVFNLSQVDFMALMMKLQVRLTKQQKDLDALKYT